MASFSRAQSSRCSVVGRGLVAVQACRRVRARQSWSWRNTSMPARRCYLHAVWETTDENCEKRTIDPKDAISGRQPGGGEDGVVPIEDDHRPRGQCVAATSGGGRVRHRRGRGRPGCRVVHLEALGERSGDLLLNLVVAVDVRDRAGLQVVGAAAACGSCGPEVEGGWARRRFSCGSGCRRDFGPFRKAPELHQPAHPRAVVVVASGGWPSRGRLPGRRTPSPRVAITAIRILIER